MLIPRGQQSPEHPGFVAQDKPYDCAACIHWHAEKYQFPNLTPENHEAWGIFNRLSDQQQTGVVTMGGVIPGTLRIEAITTYLDERQMPPGGERVHLLDKVLLVSREVTNHYRAKAEAQAEAEKSRTSKRLDV